MCSAVPADSISLQDFGIESSRIPGALASSLPCSCIHSTMLLACVTGHSAGLLDASLNDIPPATSLHALTTAATISEVRYAQEFTLLES